MCLELRLLLSYLRSLVVRVFHWHRKVRLGEPVVDDFSQLFPARISTFVRFHSS